jgi:hypothetical protein
MPKEYEIRGPSRHMLQLIQRNGPLTGHTAHDIGGIARELDATKLLLRRMTDAGYPSITSEASKPNVYHLTLKGRHALDANSGNPETRATPRQVNVMHGPTYEPQELRRQRHDRPGGSHALAHPSRIGDRLYFRDGRVTGLDGNVLVTGDQRP